VADPQAAKSRQRAALTVADLIDAFLEDHVSRLKPNTRDSYAAALAKLRRAHGSLKAVSLTLEQVAAMHRAMRATPYQANWVRAAVSKLYAWSSDQGLLPQDHPNPARRVPRYKETSRERFLTREELARLGDALATTPIDSYAIAAIRLLILTGARLNEILHARWSWLDTERGLLNLPDSKTGKKSIFLNAPAIAILAGLPHLIGNSHIFPGRKPGKPIAHLGGPWAIIKKAAKLDGLRLHDLRHSHASIGAGAGLSLPIIGRILGHSQASTTSRYAHLAADPVRQAVETIGAEIEAAMSGRKPQPPTQLRRRK
jgi:integrase